MNEQIQPCPCGSGENFADCCGRWIEAGQSPARAEQLMRSRYCAFVLRDSDYLLRTWHESTRPEQMRLEQGVSWLGLEVVACQAGGPDDEEGWVEFIAKFTARDRLHCLHERSRFVREDGDWRYINGEILPTPKAEKVGRNDPCPCGSGKKFKRCCG